MPFCTFCNDPKLAAHTYIPQRSYVSGQGASMDRNFTRRAITFRRGGRCGILVKDAIDRNFRDLERRDSRPFEDVDDVADQPTLRIEWKGYPSWTGTFRTRNTATAKEPVTLSELARSVCVGIGKFINEMSGVETATPLWKVGPGGLEVDSLALLSLQRASHGTWVASICMAQQ